MFRWFTRIMDNIRYFKVHLWRICESTKETERSVLQIKSRSARYGRGLDRLIEDVTEMKKVTKKHFEAEEESRLGLMVYEISVDDLYLLSRKDRMHVWNSDVSCFNDIIPVRLIGVSGCGKAAIKRIMKWRRECVFRITEAQINEALEAGSRNTNEELP